MQTDLSTTLGQAGIDAGLIDLHFSGFQRFPTADKPRSKNGAAIVLSVRPLRIWFTNHATGVSGCHFDGGQKFLSRAEFNRMTRVRAEARHEREQTHTDVAAHAEKLWQSAGRADPRHLYLVRKQIRPHALRQLGENLVVPVRFAGRMTSLQFISPEGGKRFLRAGRVTGCNGSIGVPANTLLIAEGFATAATLHEVLELGVAIAFNAGNLRPVAVELHRRYPQSRIVICGDNDIRTTGNPGLTSAIEAAAAVGGEYIAPQFSMKALTSALTDWNDFRTRYGSSALRAAFEEVRCVG